MSEAGKDETEHIPPSEIEPLLGYTKRIDDEKQGDPEFQRRREDLFQVIKKVDEAVEKGEMTPQERQFTFATWLAAKESEADLDSLTGVYNRRGLARRFFEEAAHLRRTNEPISVCVLDMDNLKRINDEKGHTAGDAAIKDMARVLKDNRRDYDIVARFGGDEFVIIFPEVEGENALVAAGRLQQAMREAGLVVTCSIGVAQTDGLYDWETLYNRADVAAYAAKKRGRDRVLLWGKRMPEKVDRKGQNG